MATELRAQSFSHLHELPSFSNFLRLKCFSFIHYSAQMFLPSHEESKLFSKTTCLLVTNEVNERER